MPFGAVHTYKAHVMIVLFQLSSKQDKQKPPKSLKKQTPSSGLSNKLFGRQGGLMVSALDPGANGLGSSPGRRLLLCSWARHFTLKVPHSTQVYKWVPADCWGNLTNCGGVTCDRLASHPGEVEILLAASWNNRDKLQQL